MFTVAKINITKFCSSTLLKFKWKNDFSSLNFKWKNDYKVPVKNYFFPNLYFKTFYKI